jgi:hypothetical protein
MKKIFIYFITVIIISSITTPMPAKAAIGTSVAECTHIEHQWRSALGNSLSQGFRPEVNTLNGIKLWLGGSGQVTWAIRAAEEGYKTVATNTININPGGGEFDVTFDPVTVVAGNHYYLYVEGALVNGSWAYSSDVACYPIAGALVNNISMPGVADFNFIVYGYNAPDVPADVPDTTTSSQSAPEETTTASIKVPTDLKAIDTPNDKGGSIDLTWTASTTKDIAGYKIFRSEEKDKGFMSIGATSKSIVKFTDTKATTGKKFYYFVRAYKGHEQSESSNTVDAKSISNISTTTTSKSGFMQFLSNNWLWLALGGVGIILVIAGVLIYIFVIRKRRKLNNQIQK